MQQKSIAVVKSRGSKSIYSDFTLLFVEGTCLEYPKRQLTNTFPMEKLRARSMKSTHSSKNWEMSACGRSERQVGSMEHFSADLAAGKGS